MLISAPLSSLDFACIMFTLLFVAFYLAGIITWSLWWVVSPMLVYGIIEIFGTIIGLAIYYKGRKNVKKFHEDLKNKSPFDML